MEFSLAQIEQATGARLINPASETGDLERLRATRVKGWSIDSRSVQAGDVFFAIAGDRFDGHAYVQDALDAGASAAIISQDVKTLRGPVLKGRQLR